MGERYEMKAYDGTDPDAPPSWWEGWPLTAVAVLYSAAFWGVQLLLLWRWIASLFS